MKKRILAVFTALLMLPAAGCANKDTVNDSTEKKDDVAVISEYTELTGEEYVFCAENGGLKLYFCPSTTHFKVENTADGSVWFSSPQDMSNETASKLVQMRMSASLVLDYTDVSANKSGNINTYTGSVRGKNYKIELVSSGVRFTYHLSEIEADVPLEVRLENGTLLTVVDSDKIKVGKENVKITNISVLPYFVSGSAEDDGYLFLADGSGALIRFNNSGKSTSTYSRPIYGSEPTDITSEAYLRIDDEAVRLPVWGAVRNGAAVMAIGEAGEADGYLNAAACGQIASRANAYVSYRLVNSVMHELGQYETEVYDKIQHSIGKITTRYTFLSGDKADYSGMADTYRTYLMKKYNLTDGKYNSGAYIDVYGGVEKTVSVMGVPHKKAVSLTSSEQLELIISGLSEQGIGDLTVRYRDWNKSEIFGKKVTSAKTASSVISAKQLAALTNGDSAVVYPAILDIQTYSGGNYLSHIRNAAYSVTGLPFAWHNFSVATLNDTGSAYYRNALSKLGKLTEKLIGSAVDADLKQLALGDLGSSLYCDFKNEGYRRTNAVEVMVSALEAAKGKTDSLMLEAANAYALPYADIVYSIPVSHSGQDILDESVPFYAMVISGLAEYSAPAINASNGGDSTRLYTAISGAGASYALIYENADVLKDTSLNGIYGASYSQDEKVAAVTLSEFKELAEKTENSRIVRHDWLDGVSVTTYSNGTRIYVNIDNGDVILPSGKTLGKGEFTAETEGAR